MSNYRRYLVPGGTYFFTLVTYQRQPLFANPGNVQRLRSVIASVKRESPFQFLAAVVLPDHLHFLWTLPPDDHQAYSKRIGQIEARFTQSLRNKSFRQLDLSRRKHREADVWQRRFWEHTVTDVDELEAYLNYIHYNPVEHGFVSCPHLWRQSSFSRWVASGHYDVTWGCCCGGRPKSTISFPRIDPDLGEP